MHFTFVGVAIPWWLALILLALIALSAIGYWKYGDARRGTDDFKRHEEMWTKKW